MKDIDSLLKSSIEEALQTLEDKGDIVIVSNSLGDSAKAIAEKTKEAYIGDIFTHEELTFFRMLVFEAALNDKMFHGELQAITGYSQEQAKTFGEKLKKLTSYF